MIKAIFFDLSGVLYSGNQAVYGAVGAVRKVQQSQLQVRFVTNTSRLTRASLLLGLTRLGFDIRTEQLYSAPAAALSWVKQNQLRPFCLVHENIKPEFASVDQRDPNAVIIGDAADGFNYQNMNRAFQLCQQGAALVGIGRNRYFQLNNELLLDAGPYIKAIEYAASTEAIIMGKPSPAFFEQVLNSVECEAHEALMIGDDVYGDVQGALEFGLKASLVQSGKYQSGDENLIEGNFEVFPSLVEVIDKVLEQNTE